MNKGFATEQIAREKASTEMASKHVSIILSNGEYYVEPSDTALVRTWEREIYTGLGRNALKRQAVR